MTEKRYMRRYGSFIDGTLWDNVLYKQLNHSEVCSLINEQSEDIIRLGNKIDYLLEENEQLKCGNKNLKATLNDFINICNRLQSNPNDKQTLSVARDMLQNMGKELR